MAKIVPLKPSLTKISLSKSVIRAVETTAYNFPALRLKLGRGNFSNYDKAIKYFRLFKLTVLGFAEILAYRIMLLEDLGILGLLNSQYIRTDEIKD